MAATKKEMANRQITEWIVTILSLGLIVVTVATYYLDQGKNNWASGPALLLMEIFAIGLQALVTWIVWKSSNPKIKTLLAFTSAGILMFITWLFFHFITKCS